MPESMVFAIAGKGEKMRIEIIMDHQQRSFIEEACEVKDNCPNDKYFQITRFDGRKINYPKNSFHYRNLDIRRSE